MCKIKPDDLFMMMLETAFKDALKRFGIYVPGIFYEIENKFFWISVNSGVK